MYCSNCGQVRAAGEPYCLSCGHPHETTSTGSPQTGRSAGGRAALISVAVVLAALLLSAAILFNQKSSPPATTTQAAAPSTSAAPVAPPPTISPPASPRATAYAPTALYKAVSDGVIRVETTACDGGGVGSGFLIAPDLVATVAHVVDGAVSVVLRQGSSSTTGTVVGIDVPDEIALIRAATPFNGHVFTVSRTLPDVGTDVAAIGYPLAGQESLTRGSISGQNRSIDLGTIHLSGLLQTDAGLNPGNSGGPLLGMDGVVYGLVEAKRTDASAIAYAVPTAQVGSQLSGWRTSPGPVRRAARCGAPTGPNGIRADINDASGSPDGQALAEAFDAYATGINTGDYASAYAVLSPRARGQVSLDAFARGEASSYIVTLSIARVTPSDRSTDLVEVNFTSVQDPTLGGTGQACSTWDMTYTMVDTGSGWQIDRAVPHTGSPAPC